MTYVKRYLHRLARLFRQRVELLHELNHTEACLHAMTFDRDRLLREKADLEALLAVLSVPTEVRR